MFLQNSLIQLLRLLKPLRDILAPHLSERIVNLTERDIPFEEEGHKAFHRDFPVSR